MPEHQYDPFTGVSVLEYVDIAADAGYDGIEPWVEEIDAWIEGGGTLEQVRDRAAARGIRIVNLIAFYEWAVPEADRHAGGWRRRDGASKWPGTWDVPS